MKALLGARATTRAKPSLAPAPSRLLQRKCACRGTPGPSGECAECRKKRQDTLQLRAVGPEPEEVPSIVHEVLRSPGQPLDSKTCALMEPRFGHDFSKVRVHTDTKAAESARAVNALAYAVGRDVVFGAGEYSLHTEAGRRLLAHELAHVVQQAEAPLPKAGEAVRLSRESDPEEREAQQMGKQLADFCGVELPPAANTIVRIGNRPQRRKAEKDDLTAGLPSMSRSAVAPGAHHVLWRREAVLPPDPIEENPAARMVNDEPPGLTSPAINGLTILTGENLAAALPEPQYVARPVTGGGFECRVAAPVDVISGTDMIVTTPPSAGGWRAEATPAWLADNGETLCLIRSGTVPLLMRHESDNRIFYNVVRRSEGEHHADMTELHRTILKPYHDRVAAAATTTRRGADARTCAQALARDIDWLGTLQRYATAWATAQQGRDGPGGTHNTQATLTSSDYCMDATLTLHGA